MGGIVCTMHRRENWNNLEIFKLAILLRRKRIRLVMFGALNQLPMFSLFADAVILRSMPNYLQNAYGDVIRPGHVTDMQTISLPRELNVIDMSIEPKFNGHKLHPYLEEAIKTITDEEVVEVFKFPTIWIRQSSFDLFESLPIPKNMIGCEMKEHYGSTDWKMRLRMVGDQLPLIYDRAYFRNLCNTCGEHYMAVTCLMSLLKNWMWICYGGSCNIHSFFPFKCLLLSNSLVYPDLSQMLSDARFGPSPFPMFDYQQEVFFDLSASLIEEIKRFQSR